MADHGALCGGSRRDFADAALLEVEHGHGAHQLERGVEQGDDADTGGSHPQGHELGAQDGAEHVEPLKAAEDAESLDHLACER